MAVSDFNGHSVYVFDSEGTFLRKIGQFKQPVDAVFVNDEEILVSDHGDHRIYQYNTRSGLFIKKIWKTWYRKRKGKKIHLDFPWMTKSKLSFLITIIIEYKFWLKMVRISLHLETLDRKNSF